MPHSANVASFIASHGNTWTLAVNSACEEFFEECHVVAGTLAGSPSQCIKDVAYGPHERNRLDIFRPVSERSASSDRAPVVVYFHGGGFRAGDNKISEHIHANIGERYHHVSVHGVLATYRLLPEANYPDGVEDVTMALRWLKDHAAEYGGDKNNIFAIGQSAGGAHLAMALFSGEMRGRECLPRGLVFQSAPFWYDLTQERRRANMAKYYKSEDTEEILSNCALNLFRRLGPVEDLGTQLYITVGEFDPEEIVKGNLMMLDALIMQIRRLPQFEVLMGHNHISYALGIGLEGDEVGPKILDFIRQQKD
ncbi:unnamed protein product [Clonostachys rosea]|uniref:BD-FAE-like domain-containing protein n=1 Tax=Bionectria ochroleuca TaxID=29856 RepID=A0ABY6TW69_BIOOC|nr:unnamed protein product [Clonostachys rosea]